MDGARAAAILEALPDALLVVDATGRVVGSNAAAREIWPEAEEGAELPPALRPLAERAREEGLRGTVAIGGGDLEVRALPFGEGGALLALRAPGALDRRAREAAEASRWSALAAGLAHELRNPLSGIVGAATLLERAVEEEHQELAEVIGREARRIEALLEDLLDLARPRPPAAEAVDLHRLTDDALELARARAPETVDFVRAYDPSLPRVLADAAQLMQVLQNLLYNAVDALGEGGEITIATGISVGLRQGPQGQRRSMVRLEVRDSGPGFDARVLASPFTPFLTTKSGGTGLGLALCRRIVEANRGLIEIGNLPGGGAFARCHLPRA